MDTPIITPEKRCAACGELFPATKEYFHANCSKSDGLHTYCKSCRRRESSTYYANNRDKSRAYSEKHRDRLTEYRRNRYYSDPSRFRQYARDYYANHREEARIYRQEHREKYRRWKAAYDKANHAIVSQKNREYWRRHPEKARVNKQKRRARLASAEGVLTVADIHRQLKSQGGHCWWCGSNLGNKWHVDHVIPLSRGGKNDPSNIVITCPRCNLSKGSKLPHEWIGRLL